MAVKAADRMAGPGSSDSDLRFILGASCSLRIEEL